MAREGIEKLFNITDRSYNVLNSIDFTCNTCSIISSMSTTRISSEFVDEKIITCIVQQAGESKNSLSLSLSLSLKFRGHFCKLLLIIGK